MTWCLFLAVLVVVMAQVISNCAERLHSRENECSSDGEQLPFWLVSADLPFILVLAVNDGCCSGSRGTQAKINYYNAFMDVWQLDLLRMQAEDDESVLPESQRAKILCSK
jgi:hypothetical protein